MLYHTQAADISDALLKRLNTAYGKGELLGDALRKERERLRAARSSAAGKAKPLPALGAPTPETTGPPRPGLRRE